MMFLLFNLICYTVRIKKSYTYEKSIQITVQNILIIVFMSIDAQ